MNNSHCFKIDFCNIYESRGNTKLAIGRNRNLTGDGMLPESQNWKGHYKSFRITVFQLQSFKYHSQNFCLFPYPSLLVPYPCCKQLQ